MSPNFARLLRMALPFLIVATITALIIKSLGDNGRVAQTSQGRLETAVAERQAVVARTGYVVARAADTRAVAKPMLARADSLHAQVRITRPGQLSVQNGGTTEQVLVPVPPLVTERIQADSAAISALSLALTWDARAVAAQEERVAAEAKVSDAARSTIVALEHEQRPRCGRRCGMVLGAISVVALGIALDQTRRVLH